MDWQSIKLALLKYTAYFINIVLIGLVAWGVGWYIWQLIRSAAS